MAAALAAVRAGDAAVGKGTCGARPTGALFGGVGDGEAATAEEGEECAGVEGEERAAALSAHCVGGEVGLQ